MEINPLNDNIYGMDDKFLKPYDPKSSEEKIYKDWEESGFFNPDKMIEKGLVDKEAEPFSIVLPPPNVTGTLHAGHALMLVIEDIMTRHNRMKGKRTLWLPGTDHAAIATQTKVEKIIQKEGLNKKDLGREKFLERVNQFAQESHNTIVGQLRRMGASVDWSREAFTLDEKRHKAVFEAFKRMYEDGLIYKGKQIVNWDPKGQTTISDDEIIYKEEKTKFFYFQYGPFVIGTARPETKFGDKYVVMHPEDERYKEYKHGQKIELEWINGPITATIIKDEAIDMEFGTGVMTITPWHSQVDFEIAKRHNLDAEQIIDMYGKLLPIAGEFAGRKISDARQEIVDKLKSKGLLVKEEEYTHNIATAERSGGMIEPQIMSQWFVAVNKEFEYKHDQNIGKIKKGDKTTLRKLMMESVESGMIKILPERFEKIYYHWIKNLHDWCISRQIWYGHRIPIWYGEDKEIKVSIEKPEGNWTQDEDTLDTWFSSGLWTFSTLGWPDETEDLKIYHPTSVLETGYDIIFFWVAKMVLMTTYLLGQVPFKTVYLHGLVRDAKGVKMSKSLGNIIDPVDLIDKFGADATRMSLIVGNGPGNDLNLSEGKVLAYKKFSNKLWNIARYILENTSEEDRKRETIKEENDLKYLNEWKEILKDINSDMDAFRYHLASEKLYHHVWHTFADIIIEESKPILQSEKSESRKILLSTLFKQYLIALHPFMPFITEEIWQSMYDTNFLMTHNWN